MNAHVDDLLPFYINHTLSTEEFTAVETHLADCAGCRSRLAEWEKLSVAANRVASSRVPDALLKEKPLIPPLSPLVYASLKRRPPLAYAISSAAHLIWAQRVFLAGGWLLPPLGSVIFIVALTSLGFRGAPLNGGIVPLFAVIPIIAALSAAFMYTFEDDPAWEIITTAPTSPGTLIFARLTLGLGTIGLLAFAGSLLLVIFGPTPLSLYELVAVWLGPMLLLSALTTMLSLCLHPIAAAGTALTLWGSLLLLLIVEQAGAPVVKITLLWLLHPSWIHLTGQVLLAGLLWLASWLWMANSAPSLLQSEGGR